MLNLNGSADLTGYVSVDGKSNKPLLRVVF